MNLEWLPESLWYLLTQPRAWLIHPLAFIILVIYTVWSNKLRPLLTVPVEVQEVMWAELGFSKRYADLNQKAKRRLVRKRLRVGFGATVLLCLLLYIGLAAESFGRITAIQKAVAEIDEQTANMQEMLGDINASIDELNDEAEQLRLLIAQLQSNNTFGAAQDSLESAHVVINNVSQREIRELEARIQSMEGKMDDAAAQRAELVLTAHNTLEMAMVHRSALNEYFGPEGGLYFVLIKDVVGDTEE